MHGGFLKALSVPWAAVTLYSAFAHIGMADDTLCVILIALIQAHILGDLP